MDAQGNTPGRALLAWGTILLAAAGFVRLAWEVPAVYVRLDLPSNTALYTAMAVGILLMVVGAMRNLGSQ